MKIALYANSDWFMYQFNRSLAFALKDAGHDVVLLTPPGEFHHHFAALGLRWLSVPMRRRSLNPVREVILIFRLARLLHREQIDLLNNFTLKCVIYGSLASKAISRAKIVNTITGLGYVFTNNGIKAKILKPLVLLLMKIIIGLTNSKTIVLNEEDLTFFCETFQLEKDEQIFLIPGSGVDCERFVQSIREPSGATTPFRVCLPARLLWDKGLADYVDASRIVRTKYPEIEFHLCGAIDAGNPTAIPSQTLDAWVAEGAVIWNGHVEDMANALPWFDVVVLPSHREGLPTVLTEASACGIALVASDVPGCRDVVIDGVNGFLVPKENAVALANAIEQLYLAPELRQEFGHNAREIAVRKFSLPAVIHKTLEVYSAAQKAQVAKS